MNGLLKDLEAVAGLDERATPGIIELHTSCSWRRIMAPRGRGFLVPGIDPDKHPNMDSIENAQFVVALVNWFRTHRAEIAEVVADAKLWRYLVAENNKGAHGKFRICWLDQTREGFITTDGVSCDGKDEQAIVRIIQQAMHNSAPEDGSHD